MKVTLLPDTGDALAFWRRRPERSCLVALNMSAQDSKLWSETAVNRRIYTACPDNQWDKEPSLLTLQGYEV